MRAPARGRGDRVRPRVVGVDEVEFLRLPDGILEYGVGCGARSRRSCDDSGPTIAMTINFRDTFGGTSLNQADHIAVGKALWTRSATPGTGGCSPSS